MSNDDSAAVRAGHAYFKGTQEPYEKGSAMNLIDAAKDAQVMKTARLKAARLVRDEAQAVIDAEAVANAPVKKTRKKKVAP